MTHAPDEILAVTLARIETKLDNVIAGQADFERRTIAGHQDHEGRLRLVERRLWSLPSVAVLLSVAAVIIPFVR